jgi:hypothetical protein
LSNWSQTSHQSLGPSDPWYRLCSRLPSWVSALNLAPPIWGDRRLDSHDVTSPRGSHSVNLGWIEDDMRAATGPEQTRAVAKALQGQLPVAAQNARLIARGHAGARHGGLVAVEKSPNLPSSFYRWEKQHMRIRDFFSEILGARLWHWRWSWGAADENRQVVFLRVWRDEFSRDEKWVKVDWLGASEPSRGGKERK